MITPVPMTESLDHFLSDVVRSMHAAVSLGIKSIERDPATADQVLKDCTETLDVIMRGQVQEWIAA